MDLQKEDIDFLEKGIRSRIKRTSTKRKSKGFFGTLFGCFCPPKDDLDAISMKDLDSVKFDVE